MCTKERSVEDIKKEMELVEKENEEWLEEYYSDVMEEREEIWGKRLM